MSEIEWESLTVYGGGGVAELHLSMTYLVASQKDASVISNIIVVTGNIIVDY